MIRILPALALVLLLTACGVSGKNLDKLTQAPTPVFSSEEEALAAAVEVYGRFVQIGDEIGHDGGRNADRLDEVATGQFLEDSVDGFTSWIDKGWRQVGVTSFRDAELQQYTSGTLSTVLIYICEDISLVDVLDGQNVSVVSIDRVDSNYLQVAFDLDERGRLLVSSRERWDERAC